MTPAEKSTRAACIAMGIPLDAEPPAISVPAPVCHLTPEQAARAAAAIMERRKGGEE